MKHDVVIIGGGLGGLECAYILSRIGVNVLVLEQGQQAGGCMQSYKRGSSCFDTGFHYVGGLDEGQSLHTAFNYMGLLDLPWQKLDSEGFDHVSVMGNEFVFKQGFDAFEAQLASDFPHERKALKSYTDLLRLITRQQTEALSPHYKQDDSYFKLNGISAWQYLNDNFSDPLLISVLSGTSLKMELRKDSLPLSTFLHGNSSYIESSWRLNGGGSLIADKLISGILEQGGSLVCGAKVTELTERDGSIQSATCSNGETYEGGIFISDIHPASTIELVRQSDRIRHTYRQRMSQFQNTNGMFTVSLKINPHTVRYFNYNQYVYDTPDIWADSETGSGVKALLITCRKANDGDGYTEQIDLLTPMSWNACDAWAGTRPGRRGLAYEELKSKMADGCLDIAERFIPHLRDASKSYTSTPLTWHDYTLTPCGSAYGVRKDYRQPLLTMLSPRTPVPNLLMTGQSLMLHGVHGVTMTALFTCAEVIGKEKIWNIVSGRG